MHVTCAVYLLCETIHNEILTANSIRLAKIIKVHQCLPVFPTLCEEQGIIIIITSCMSWHVKYKEVLQNGHGALLIEMVCYVNDQLRQ